MQIPSARRRRRPRRHRSKQRNIHRRDAETRRKTSGERQKAKPESAEGTEGTEGSAVAVGVTAGFNRGNVHRRDTEKNDFKGKTRALRGQRTRRGGLSRQGRRLDIADCSSIGIKDNYLAYIHFPKETNTFAGVAIAHRAVDDALPSGRTIRPSLLLLFPGRVRWTAGSLFPLDYLQRPRYCR
jgi:hypothetical protein